MKLATTTRNAVLGAIALTLTPAAAIAAANVDTTYETRDHDDDFDFGWLGLLGLAGLLGLKKKDRDVHVDARNTTR